MSGTKHDTRRRQTELHHRALKKQMSVTHKHITNRRQIELHHRAFEKTNERHTYRQNREREERENRERRESERRERERREKREERAISQSLKQINERHKTRHEKKTDRSTSQSLKRQMSVTNKHITSRRQIELHHRAFEKTNERHTYRQNREREELSLIHI